MRGIYVMKIAVIPARGGSKRIPRKNIKDFFGKPIIAWSIEAARESQCFDKVIVSTDDEEIADVARSFGAHVPFVRPKELSDDHTTTLPVIQHAIKWVEDSGDELSYVCCIYATAPFIDARNIIMAYEQLVETKLNYCFSVTDYGFPIQRALKIRDDNGIDMFYPEFRDTRSQDLESGFHDAGQFYWGKRDSWMAGEPVFSQKASPFILPRYLVQDIDTIDDWRRAELIYSAIVSP